MPDSLRNKLEKAVADWNELSEPKRQQILENFVRIFELSEKEKTKVLNEYTEAERQRMEKTLETFERLPKAQRDRCINGFQKFADLSPEERQQFLSNAAIWRNMTAYDRLAWRALVNRVSFKPPNPPGLGGPPPPPRPNKPGIAATSNTSN